MSVQRTVELPIEYVESAAGIKLPLISTSVSLLTSTVAPPDVDDKLVKVVVVVILRTSILSPDSGASVNVNVVPHTP